MKKEKIVRPLTMIMLAICLFASTITFADESEQSQGVSYAIEFENDTPLENAVLINQEVVRDNGRISTIKTYRLEDGRNIIDTFTRGDELITRSPNGSDTATKTRDFGEATGKIVMTASFSWRTEGNFSYVKCTSMSASKSYLSSNVVYNIWETDYTSDEVTIGKASASLEYYIHLSHKPYVAEKGTIKITCTDTGTISDNF